MVANHAQSAPKVTVLVIFPPVKRFSSCLLYSTSQLRKWNNEWVEPTLGVLYGILKPYKSQKSRIQNPQLHNHIVCHRQVENRNIIIAVHYRKDQSPRISLQTKTYYATQWARGTLTFDIVRTKQNT